jgi:hypothetical protein
MCLFSGRIACRVVQRDRSGVSCTRPAVEAVWASRGKQRGEIPRLEHTAAVICARRTRPRRCRPGHPWAPAAPVVPHVRRRRRGRRVPDSPAAARRSGDPASVAPRRRPRHRREAPHGSWRRGIPRPARRRTRTSPSRHDPSRRPTPVCRRLSIKRNTLSELTALERAQVRPRRLDALDDLAGQHRAPHTVFTTEGHCLSNDSLLSSPPTTRLDGPDLISPDPSVERVALTAGGYWSSPSRRRRGALGPDELGGARRPRGLARPARLAARRGSSSSREDGRGRRPCERNPTPAPGSPPGHKPDHVLHRLLGAAARGSTRRPR